MRYVYTYSLLCISFTQVSVYNTYIYNIPHLNSNSYRRRYKAIHIPHRNYTHISIHIPLHHQVIRDCETLYISRRYTPNKQPQLETYTRMTSHYRIYIITCMCICMSMSCTYLIAQLYIYTQHISSLYIWHCTTTYLTSILHHTNYQINTVCATHS